MIKQSQLNEHLNPENKPIISLNHIQNASTLPSDKQGAGLLWGGLGLLALCGLCCSAPVLAGLSAMFGTVAVIGVAWPVIGLLVALLLGIVILFRMIRRNTTTTGKISACSANHCDTAGACGCKK